MIEWDLRGCLPVGEDEYILPERENVAQSFGEQKTRLWLSLMPLTSLSSSLPPKHGRFALPVPCG